MSDFTKVLPLANLPDGQKQTVIVDDRIVVLARVQDQVYCIDDVCTHDGGPLGEGTLEGFLIACPRHGAKFDVRNGAAVTMPATEPTLSHQVKIEEGQILVKLTEEGGSNAVPTPEDATSVRITEDHVREELKKVIDPELFVNIIDLGLVYQVDLIPNTPVDWDVAIEMTMTSPACPAGPQLIASAKNIVGQLRGVNNVEVKIVMDPPWTPDRMTDDARDQLGIF